MSDREILDWIHTLGADAKTQAMVIRDLLRNAYRDRMIAEDLIICRKGLDMLEGGGHRLNG